jgi:hypothetical protein
MKKLRILILPVLLSASLAPAQLGAQTSPTPKQTPLPAPKPVPVPVPAPPIAKPLPAPKAPVPAPVAPPVKAQPSTPPVKTPPKASEVKKLDGRGLEIQKTTAIPTAPPKIHKMDNAPPKPSTRVVERPARPAPSRGNGSWQFSTRLENGGKDLVLEGEIDFAGIKAFREYVQNTPQLERIVLSSPGGVVVAAELMAQAVRKRELKTYVPDLCASACTLIFLSGKDRTMAKDALIGFHQASAKSLGGDGPDERTVAFDSNLRKFYVSAGLNAKFIEQILATPYTDMLLPSAEELLKEKVLTAAPK